MIALAHHEKRFAGLTAEKCAIDKRLEKLEPDLMMTGVQIKALRQYIESLYEWTEPSRPRHEAAKPQRPRHLKNPRAREGRGVRGVLGTGTF